MNYIQDLLAKSSNALDVVQPRPLSRFEMEPLTSDATDNSESPGSQKYAVPKQTGPGKYEEPFDNQKQNIRSFGNKNPSIDQPLFSKQKVPENDPINQSEDSGPLETGHVNEENVDLKVPKPILDSQVSDSLKHGTIENKPVRDSTVSVETSGILKQQSFPNPYRQNDLKNHQEKTQTSSQVLSPTIKISIGKVEVRAVKETKKPPPSSKRKSVPQLTLQDYINTKK